MITEAEIFAAKAEIEADGGPDSFMKNTPNGPFVSLALVCAEQIGEAGIDPLTTLAIIAGTLRIAFEVGARVGRKQATTELTKVGGEEGAG